MATANFLSYLMLVFIGKESSCFEWINHQASPNNKLLTHIFIKFTIKKKMVSKRFSSCGALGLKASLFKPSFAGSFSDLVEMAKNTTKEDIINFGFNIDSFYERTINPLFIEKTANIKKENFNDNLFYLYDDFYSKLKTLKRKVEKGDYFPGPEINRKLKEEIDTFNNKVRKLTNWDKIIEDDKFDFRQIDELMNSINICRIRFKSVRKEGKPFNAFNMAIYDLINRLTLHGYDKRRKPLQVRNWDLNCFILLWIHFNKVRFKELDNFIEKHGNKSSALLLLKKKLQRIYSHFEPKTGSKNRFVDIGISKKILTKSLLGFKKVIVTDTGYKLFYK